MRIENRIRKLEENQARKPVMFYLVTKDGVPLDPTQEPPKSSGTFEIVDPKQWDE